MKKCIIIVVLLLTIASLPFIGNSFVKSTIDERLIELKSFGLETSVDEENSCYLSTSRHFEFLLTDSEAFINYLDQYQQLPPDVGAIIDGAVVGADIKYSNLTFAKAFEIEIYPIALSAKMNDELRVNDLGFYKFTKKVLERKEILYHIEYNLLNDDFKAYFKDIAEEYTFENSTKLLLSLEDASFKGSGEPFAPKELSSKVKKFHFKMFQKEEILELSLKDFKSSSSFSSLNTYVTSTDIKTALMTFKDNVDDINVKLEKLRVNVSSNEQGETTELDSNISIKKFEYSSKNTSYEIEKFNFDIALSELDKVAYTKFVELASKNNTNATDVSLKEMQMSAMELLSKGLVLEIPDFSIDEFKENDTNEIGGFEIKTRFVFKKDAELMKKVQFSPLMAAQNIELESEIKISKEMFEKLKRVTPMLMRLDGLEKEDGDDLIFVVKFVDLEESVNGKSLN